jgi:hypothetical protein
MVNLRGTKEYFNKIGMELKWMLTAIGPPTIFITCSCAEYYSEPFLNYLRTMNSSVPGIDRMTPAELCAMNPVSVSIHFTKKWDSIFNCLIKTKENPLFGEVSDYFWRIEYQARGAPHIQCLLWIKNAPVNGINTPDEIEKFISSIATCSIQESAASPTLHSLVTKFQKHKCNRYCMKSYKKRQIFQEVFLRLPQARKD